ncbi:MAG: replicative DNA helicase [Lachnospiraceae bacterium]|nr:replicative DNA helicase [Lachnospiraceae bacterium]
MDDNLIKQVPPHMTEAEDSVIGAMLSDQEVIAKMAEMLVADDFYNPVYRKLFQAMTDLYSDGILVDDVMLADRLKEMGVAEEYYAKSYLAGLIANLPTSQNAERYAVIVRENALLRKMIRISGEIINDCYDVTIPCDAVMESAEKKIFNLLQTKMSSEYVPIDQITRKALMKIEAVARSNNPITGLPTGFADLDSKTAGLQKSDLILIAARPSMGKTAFTLNLMENVCMKAGASAVFFSLEMPGEQLVNRLLSMNSGVDSQKIRTGKLNELEWVELLASSKRVSQSKIIIDDTSNISIGELRSKCRKYKLEMDIQLIMIDYLQLMRGSDRAAKEGRQNEISEISRSLKALARELNVPVVALSQLSRNCEKRDDKRPMLSDLRDSGAIEQDADVVMFLYRDEYYKKDNSKQKGITQVIVAKQRNGPVGTVYLTWIAALTKFRNYEGPEIVEE